MPSRAVGVLAVLMLALPCQAQTLRYWPELEIGFPVAQAVLDQSPRPVKLRLYSAPANGRFERVSELSVNQLERMEKGRGLGFKYTARGDGEEKFAVQLVFADGTVSPSEDMLKADSRVIFDTKPPVVSLTPLGANGAQWTVTDDNLDNTTIRLECRWSGGDNRWFEVKSRNFNARDDYTWTNLNNRPLEVRLSAKDKAGHEAVSRIVKLPDTGGRGVDAAPISTLPNASSRNLDDIPNAQTQIVYVNRRDLTVRSKLTHVTRSGVSKVHLYVKDLSGGPGGDWKFDSTKTVDIRFDSSDTTVEMPYIAQKDGRYGFIVIPESGVGRREPEPRSSAPAQHLVEVDTVKPNVKIRTVTVSPGGTIGPRVEIEWDADDRNLMPDPIVLEYAADKNATTWLSIAEKIPNSRRYVWEVSDKTMFKLYIRARATDKATNVGENIYDQPVIIDLDKPSATIDNIRGSGSGSPQTNERPPVLSPGAGSPVPYPNVTPGPVMAPSLPPSGR